MNISPNITANKWTLGALGLEKLDVTAQNKLNQLAPFVLPAGHILFRPGDKVSGFVMALSGRVGVYLTGPSGRELLLYSVTPGQTCVQTTLGLLGEQRYMGEAIAETDISVVVVPKALFVDLMDQSQTFRNFVFRAFAEHLQTVMGVLEKVAFVTIEARLAQILLDRAKLNQTKTGPSASEEVHATHQELSTMIGTSREVVSRRLDVMAKAGLVAQDRGVVKILNKSGLKLRAVK